MITKEQFDKSYIVNDYGVLRDKYLKLASSFGYTIAESGYEDEVLFKGSFKIIQQWSTLASFKYSHFNKYVNRNELTLEDFNEEGEEMVEDKKIIQKYTREEFNTRGQALDSYDSGVVFYTPSNDGYSVVDETGILDHFGQLFTLEEREGTWQDVAQEFIKNDPVLSGDKFVEDMFGDDFTEYHEPMKQLAKIIVENSK